MSGSPSQFDSQVVPAWCVISLFIRAEDNFSIARTQTNKTQRVTGELTFQLEAIDRA